MPSFTCVSSELKIRAQMECLLAPLGVLFEKETLRDAMLDETLRPFTGRILKDELMPLLPPDGRDEAVISACRLLSAPGVSPRCDEMLEGLTGNFSLHLLPHITAKTKGLVMYFAAYILLFASVRKGASGWEIIGSQGDVISLSREENALKMFSSLSCDMQADSLAYAVLADEDVWGRDLRQKEGLCEALEQALCDIQMLGLSEAMRRVWKA